MIWIYGVSDDLVCVEGEASSYEDFNGDRREDGGTFGVGYGAHDKAVCITLSDDEGERLHVVMRYADTPKSCGWTAEIMQAEEPDGDEPGAIPWPVTVRTPDGDDMPDHSVMVEVECPEDVAVSRENL